MICPGEVVSLQKQGLQVVVQPIKTLELLVGLLDLLLVFSVESVVVRPQDRNLLEKRVVLLRQQVRPVLQLHYLTLAGLAELGGLAVLGLGGLGDVGVLEVHVHQLLHFPLGGLQLLSELVVLQHHLLSVFKVCLECQLRLSQLPLQRGNRELVALNEWTNDVQRQMALQLLGLLVVDLVLGQDRSHIELLQDHIGWLFINETKSLGLFLLEASQFNLALSQLGVHLVNDGPVLVILICGPLLRIRDLGSSEYSVRSEGGLSTSLVQSVDVLVGRQVYSKITR